MARDAAADNAVVHRVNGSLPPSAERWRGANGSKDCALTGGGLTAALFERPVHLVAVPAALRFGFRFCCPLA
jgi:hypothetical protein